MKFARFSIFFLLACASVLALASENTTQISLLQSLFTPKKLGIFVGSQLRPSSLVKWSDLFSPDDIPWIDFTFVDFRQLLTQIMKVPSDLPIPEIDYSFPVYINESGYAFNGTMSMTSGETQIFGQQNITSVNEVTPTFFKNTFRVPSFVWRSPKAGIQLYDNTYDEYYRAQNFTYEIQQLTLNTSANYEFVPDIGIQISNFSIEYELGYLGYSVGDFIFGYLNGTTTYPGLEEDVTEAIFYAWQYNQADYIAALQFRINCVLSGSRNNPDRCELNDEEMYVNPRYYKMNVLQLFETIGLGSMNTS
ncbi:unnamed protein product [Orchesella dallaii]|uniref:Uncharacterized protein n=1 Tax=Orchesella dallaii TaxID=48710 RepID=A0ABP1RUX9_9HEXA